ncbi:MAG: metallophosphoesterase family protein [Eubacteriales bacterium]|nr:metallophosphoesterase family protein [Eubacteriales bacterium]
MRYYIADSHFFHGSLNDKMDCRGFSTPEEMNQYMLQKWNQKVRPQDEVVILGDLSWGKAEETNELLKKLHGKLYLIQGNHDRFLKNNAYDAARFVWIKPYEELHDQKRKVVLCHYPILCYNGQYRLDAQGNPKTYMLYGHVHDTIDQRLLETFQQITRETQRTGFDGETRPIPCHMINCFCKYSDYEPLTLDEWIENDRKRRERQKGENLCAADTILTGQPSQKR